MQLDYLDFDYSEDADGHGSFDAMAAADPQHLPALLAEVARVLAWAEAQFPGARGPLEEGGLWDYELQGVEEVATPLSVRLTGAGLELARGRPGAPRITLSLTLGGTGQFCAALRTAFELDAG